MNNKSRQKLKLKLHKEGMRNAAAVTPQGANLQYLCPLCGAQKLIKELTLEHAPPKALGGKVIILTCSDCNNVLGHQADSEAAKQKKQTDLTAAIMGNANFKENDMVKLIANNLELNTAINRIEDKPRGINFTITPGNNNPRTVEQFKQTMISLSKSKDTAQKFLIRSIAPYNYKPQEASKSHLKTAFLGCTALLGYSYAFMRQTQEIRRYLARDVGDIPKVLAVERLPITVSPKITIFQETPLILARFSNTLIGLPHPFYSKESYDRAVDLFDQQKLDQESVVTAEEFPWPSSFIALLDNDPSVTVSHHN